MLNNRTIKSQSHSSPHFYTPAGKPSCCLAQRSSDSSYIAGLQTLLWDALRTAGKKINVSGIPNCLNYSAILWYIHNLLLLLLLLLLTANGFIHGGSVLHCKMGQ